MTYRQITRDERYTISLCKAQGMKPREIADFIGRHRSTVYRELARNRSRDGCYRYTKAQEMTNGRRCRSRQVRRIGPAELGVVEHFIREDFSPEQVSGYLSKEGILSISHETIYRHVWEDKRRGGDLYCHLRWSRKKRRKRYGRYDSRGRLAGKRKIDERPPEVEDRLRVGDWEADTVMGSGDRHCVLTLVERKTGYVAIGKLEKRTAEALNKRAVSLIRAQERAVHTVTADNGTEFHSYKGIERATGAVFYFATPHHAWERGTNENTNGLIRQYLPKGKSMAQVTQRDCYRIAAKLNNRPRKRLGFQTPRECYESA